MTPLEHLINYTPEHKAAWAEAQRCRTWYGWQGAQDQRERREAVPTPAQIGGRVPLQGIEWTHKN